jgi:3-hydroxypropanoate dehydrogenase
LALPTAVSELGRQWAEAVAEDALDWLFYAARSQNGWLDRPVDKALIRRIYDFASLAPTSMNGQPMRIVFVHSEDGKERLRPAMTAGNVTKMMTAPVVAIIGYDVKFYERLARTFPHSPDAARIFRQDRDLAQITALRNGTIQAAYLLLAARALGLDCGPMSGFDHSAVEEQFFHGTDIRINFLCGLGYGNHEKLYDRLPRLPFDETCTFA